MRVLAAVLVLAGFAAPAQAASVDLMVAGRAGVLRAPGPVKLRTAEVRVEGRTCRVAAATPLAVLARTSLELRLEDFGRCSKHPADASQLYVRGIAEQVERRVDGWVYKVGHRTPSAGAGDPSNRLKAGSDVLWFWCRMGVQGCQRTLEAVPDRRAAAPGEAISVTVRGYDDAGRSKVVRGATVRVGGAAARTDGAGVATVAVPAGARGTLDVVATAPKLVRSFPVEVRIR